MYSLEGTTLFSYGVRVAGSTGVLDFPTRKPLPQFGYFDEDGEQAYTDADMIMFQARAIVLDCHYRKPTASFITGWETFLTMLKATGLKTLATPYSSYTHEVLCCEPVNMQFENNRFAATRAMTFQLPFIEPTTADIPAEPDITAGAAASKWSIDNYDLWENFGMRVQRVTGLLDKPARKRYTEFSDIWVNGDRPFIAVGVPSYYFDESVAKFEARDVVMEGYFTADSRQELVDNLRAFKWLLYQANVRYLKSPNSNVLYHVYSKDGGRVTMLKTAGRAFATFTLPLRLITTSVLS